MYVPVSSFLVIGHVDSTTEFGPDEEGEDEEVSRLLIIL